MRKVKIEPTFQTPSILLDAENNLFEIKGNSLPNNPRWFYMPLLEWLESYAARCKPESVFTFRILHQNSASVKMFHEMMKIFERIHQSGYKIRVDWFYPPNDQDMLEAALELQKTYAFPIFCLPMEPEAN
jgi:hypothetical protein